MQCSALSMVGSGSDTWYDVSMKPETRVWVALAEQDLGAATMLARAGFSSGSVFHYAQAVDKLLKALWVETHEAGFPPRTHDMLELLSPPAEGGSAGPPAHDAEIAAALGDLRRSLSREIRVEALILYGSYVNGTPDEWSDVDLAVISPDFEGVPLWKRQDMIARLTAHQDRRISPIGYPSSEYHHPGPHSFLREIIRTGRVVRQAE